MPLKATVLLAVLLFSRTSYSAALPPVKQAIFLMRIIAYDANLKSRAGATINIAILAQKGDLESEKASEAILQAFMSFESARLAGLPVKATRLFFAGRESLERTVRDEGIDTFYVCSSLDANLADIKSVARSSKVLTVGSQEGYLKLGLSLGVFNVDGKNTILVNLDASRAEGAAFGPDLLRLATVVR
jgi:hypothetical protein